MDLQIALRADAGYFAGQLARAAAAEGMVFAIGAKRIGSMWKALGGIPEDAWHDAIDMTNAQVAVSPYKPADWPDGTVLLIRRVKLDPEQVSADPRSRRRRTLHPDQRALPIPERLAVHRTIVAVDVEGFGDRRRTNPNQMAIREGLYDAMREAFGQAGIPWNDRDHEDRGDGMLVLVGPEVPQEPLRRVSAVGARERAPPT